MRMVYNQMFIIQYYCILFFDSENRLFFMMKQATIYYIAFHITFISLRLFAFERECIKQQQHKNKLLYMMVQPTIFNVSFQCHLYSICTMPQLFHNDKRHLTCAAYDYYTLTDNAYFRCFLKVLGAKMKQHTFSKHKFYIFYISIFTGSIFRQFPFLCPQTVVRL